MNGFLKGFYVMNRSYPNAGAMPEIMIGLYDPGGGCRAEFGMRWYVLDARRLGEPRLEIFRDAWGFFFSTPELSGLAALPAPVSQQDVIALLLKNGFIDLTGERTDR